MIFIIILSIIFLIIFVLYFNIRFNEKKSIEFVESMKKINKFNIQNEPPPLICREIYELGKPRKSPLINDFGDEIPHINM